MSENKKKCRRIQTGGGMKKQQGSNGGAKDMGGESGQEEGISFHKI
jgi:hypothetical protein